MTIDEDSLISLDELRPVLSAREGPPRARPRTRRPRRPYLPVAVVAVLLLGVVAVFGYWQLDEDVDRKEGAASTSDAGLRHVELPSLPPGPQRIEGGAGAEAVVERVTLEEMIARANVVFVGTVAEIGGTEILSRDEEGFALEANRVRYRIDRVLRGDPVDQIDITNLALAAFPAAVGERYLIFAEWRPLGESRIRRLVPPGYPQGVYEVVSPDRASNVTNGTVSIEDVAGRVAATDVG